MKEGVLQFVVLFKAVPGKRDELEKVLLNLTANSRKDAGCLRYDMHRDNRDDNTFVLYEDWESRELWKQHFDGPATAQFGTESQGLLESSELHELTRLVCD